MGTVLVVDDNDDTCRTLAAFLQRGGYRAICATSATEAIAKLRDARQPLPDLVITDLMMPGGSGIELIRELRATPHTRDLSVIVCSAVSEQRYVDEAMDAGATDYWLKSVIHPSDLQQRIAAFLPDGGAGWSAPLRRDPVHAS